jgi:branched-chain amino acid transport system ATP-binding protein
MLKVSNIEVSYGDYQVIWGVSLEVAEGEMVSLLGPNGSGKSTVFNTISGLLKPRSGSIELAGKRIDGQATHDIVRLGLAHILERRRVFPYLTVRENLWLGAYHPDAKPHREQTLQEIYALFPRLKERERQMAHS